MILNEYFEGDTEFTVHICKIYRICMNTCIVWGESADSNIPTTQAALLHAHTILLVSESLHCLRAQISYMFHVAGIHG